MEINTFIDICSGIGGGRLGLENIGMHCIGRSDTSKLSDTTYQIMHNTNNEKNYGNLKKIKIEELPDFDMLIAGFPCQTFSVIGRKEGFDDSRGQLIFHIAHIIKEKQPACFLLENVKGLVTHDKGNTINKIVNTLECAGYDVAYKVLSSLDFGVPQMRQRVYFVGIRKGIIKNISEFPWPKSVPIPSLSDYLVDNNLADRKRLEILYYYLNNPTNAGKYSVSELEQMEGKILDTRMNDLRIYNGRCPTLRSQRDGILYVRNHKIYQLTGYEALLLQGFPKEVAIKAKEKVSDRHLLMQAGNAMTVNVISALGSSLQKYISKSTEGKIMSTTWLQFEIDSTNYLNNRFNKYAKFIHKGNEDSTIPDILVKPEYGKEFYIEAKQAPAQCGQFVLLPNDNKQKFDYSSKNAFPANEYSEKITEIMNKEYESFKNAGTIGKDIIFDNCKNVFAKWIINYYSNKGVRYIITNNYLKFPLENISDYFDITAKYRIKRSGSSTVGYRNIEEVSKYINDNFKDINISENGSDVLVQTNYNIDMQRFYCGKYEYMFSKTDENAYRIRRLSNTYNANVIFSVKLKDNIPDGISETHFIELLQENKKK